MCQPDDGMQALKRSVNEFAALHGQALALNGMHPGTADGLRVVKMCRTKLAELNKVVSDLNDAMRNQVQYLEERVKPPPAMAKKPVYDPNVF